MAGTEIPLAFLREMCIITGYASEYGLVAQLGERSVRIPMAAHRPVSFSPRFRSDFSPKSSKIEKLENLLFVVKTPQKAAIWAHSSAGRAFGSHPRGRGFESLWVHHFEKNHRQFGGDFSFDHNYTTDGRKS